MKEVFSAIRLAISVVFSLAMITAIARMWAGTSEDSQSTLWMLEWLFDATSSAFNPVICLAMVGLLFTIWAGSEIVKKHSANSTQSEIYGGDLPTVGGIATIPDHLLPDKPKNDLQDDKPKNEDLFLGIGDDGDAVYLSDFETDAGADEWLKTRYGNRD